MFARGVIRTGTGRIWFFWAEGTHTPRVDQERQVRSTPEDDVFGGVTRRCTYLRAVAVISIRQGPTSLPPTKVVRVGRGSLMTLLQTEFIASNLDIGATYTGIRTTCAGSYPRFWERHYFSSRSSNSPLSPELIGGAEGQQRGENEGASRTIFSRTGGFPGRALGLLFHLDRTS